MDKTDNEKCPGSGKPGHYAGDATLGARYLCSVCQMAYTKPVWWGFKGSSDTNAPDHVCQSPTFVFKED